MGNALFIIWRESAEAMLVVGILYAWLRKHPDAKRGMRYLWAGVGAGVGLALALAAVMLGIARMLSERGSRVFPACDDARRGRPHRADGVLDAQARPHVPARSRDGHAGQCRDGELVGLARRRRAGGRTRERRDGRLPVRSRRAGHERVEFPRRACARPRGRVAHVLGAAAGKPALFVAHVLSLQRDPAVAAGRAHSSFPPSTN